jgi:hypothetical protein
MPGSSSSNDNGRSLEYLITDYLASIRGAQLTSRAQADQSRDAETVSRIDQLLRKSFSKSAKVIVPWILSEIKYAEGNRFLVDRRPDADPGVADLTISKGSRDLQVSVKHNHDALSHPRPYSLADAMGLNGVAIELDHRKRLDTATRRFRTAAGGATEFSEVPSAKLKLYQSVCDECAKTVNSVNSNSNAAKTLFEFLVGFDFKKVIVRTNRTTRSLASIEVADYSRIGQPQSVVASVDHRPRASSLILEFDNGWIIDLRIKNASTRISSSGQVSLKFDAQKKAGTIPPVLRLL